MIKRKVRYIDSFCGPTMHVQYNVSLLLIIAHLFEEVRCFSYSNSDDYLKRISYINSFSKNIIYRPICVLNSNGKLNLLFKYIVSTIQNIRLLVTSSQDELIIYNYNNLFSLSIINKLNFIYNRKIIICCHGELELFSNEYPSGGILHRILKYLLKSFFLFKNRSYNNNIYYLVLGDVIKRNLKKYISSELYDKFMAIDHPYIFRPFEKNKEESKDSLHIGSIGVFNVIKGGHLFKEVALALNLRENKRLKMSITGRVFYDIKSLKDAGIDLPVNDGKYPLSIEGYNYRIRKLDFILFLYPASSYKLSASGAVFDAIDNNIPIIALKNDYFVYLFEKYGAWGYLANNLDEVKNIVNKLLNDQYKLQYDFDNIKESLSISSLADLFAKQMLQKKI